MKYATKLNVNGVLPADFISFKIKKNKYVMYRCFCKCGYVGAGWLGKCPVCGSEAVYLGEKSFCFTIPSVNSDYTNINIWSGTISYDNDQTITIDSYVDHIFSIKKDSVFNIDIFTMYKIMKHNARCIDLNDETAIAIQRFIPDFRSFMSKMFIYREGFLFPFVSLMLMYNHDVYSPKKFYKTAPNGETYLKNFSEMLSKISVDTSRDWISLLKEPNQITMKSLFSL